MEICRLATCGHGLQRSSNYFSGIRCRIFRRGEAAHVKFGQGSAVADKSARRAASPSRQTCCKQIRWMLSVIKLHLPTSDSSAILAWSSKLMVDCDSMGLTAFRSQISEFFPQLAVTWLRNSRNVAITRIHCHLSWEFGFRVKWSAYCTALYR